MTMPLPKRALVLAFALSHIGCASRTTPPWAPPPYTVLFLSHDEGVAVELNPHAFVGAVDGPGTSGATIYMLGGMAVHVRDESAFSVARLMERARLMPPETDRSVLGFYLADVRDHNNKTASALAEEKAVKDFGPGDDATRSLTTPRRAGPHGRP